MTTLAHSTPVSVALSQVTLQWMHILYPTAWKSEQTLASDQHAAKKVEQTTRSK